MSTGPAAARHTLDVVRGTAHGINIQAKYAIVGLFGAVGCTAAVPMQTAVVNRRATIAAACMWGALSLHSLYEIINKTSYIDARVIEASERWTRPVS